MTLKQRVIQYCDYAGIKISAFERRASLSNGYFNQVKKDPSPSKLSQIKSIFPDLNIEWLLTGEGQMLNTQIDQPAAGSDAMFTDGADYQTMKEMKLFEALERRDREVDRLICIIERMQGIDAKKTGGGKLNP